MNNLLGAKENLMNTYATLPITLDHGIGSKLYDINGKEYIDFTSGIGVSSLGYGHEGWVNAVTEQVKKLAHTSNIFLNEPVLNLAKKITEISNMKKVFFANSGAEANEGAIKLARKYSYDKYGEGRNTIITLNKSFHGRTITTLKATGQEKFHKYFYPFTEGFKYADANDIESLTSCVDESTCAIMIEAIQGEGGVNPLKKYFVDEIFKIATEKDLLVIFDEVQCGIGRTGKLYGFNNFNVEPDIVTLAKGLGAGLPIGAILCTEKLQETFKPGDHGSTFGGNPVVTSGALEVLNIVSQDNFLNEVSKKGNLIKTFFKNASSSKVTEVRGMGLMIGIEITEEASKIQKVALDNGLLVLTAGPNVLRMLPPLIISNEELENGLSILLQAIESV
ncbi:aspartate aminotransferase family protein [Clostridium sp. 'White wine YQ']|uniref:aspartate aminotransferase family protein n=1 Tax=Clostridium sp. 'White wine YQ' TaxID=3027474 RepID=UPI0023673BF7|nr:aspartate aminotransferase family protein [Clostridium sp. 'White wine YQ']MDD7794927.1 aspartate aminotransferase family protein [Clostridium sp. 'White wine YQ']